MAIGSVGVCERSSSWLQVTLRLVGSTALVAYLPDGDIDFAIDYPHQTEDLEGWILALYKGLRAEQLRPSNSRMLISDPHDINAEVSRAPFTCLSSRSACLSR